MLHAGDYISPFVASHFKQLKAPLIGVFGNNDGDRELLKKKFAEFGADIRGNFAFVAVDGLRIALFHGDETELVRFLLELESLDVLVSGHTHVAKTYRKGRTLVINPGEACGYLSGKPTIAILDTKTLNAKMIQLNQRVKLRKKLSILHTHHLSQVFSLPRRISQITIQAAMKKVPTMNKPVAQFRRSTFAE